MFLARSSRNVVLRLKLLFPASRIKVRKVIVLLRCLNYRRHIQDVISKKHTNTGFEAVCFFKS